MAIYINLKAHCAVPMCVWTPRATKVIINVMRPSMLVLMWHDVDIPGTDTLRRVVGRLGPYTWFNPPMPGLQSRALYCTMCAWSLANSTFTGVSIIVSLLIWFDLILKCVFLVFYYMTIIYALMILLVAMLVTTIIRMDSSSNLLGQNYREQYYFDLLQIDKIFIKI